MGGVPPHCLGGVLLGGGGWWAAIPISWNMVKIPI